MNRLLVGAGEDPTVRVYIGTNDKVGGRWRILKNNFRDLVAIVKDCPSILNNTACTCQ